MDCLIFDVKGFLISIFFLLLVSQIAIAQKWNAWILQPEQEALIPAQVDEILNTEANMVVITPLAITADKVPIVEWNMPWQWVGERDSGIISALILLEQMQLKTAVKPMLTLDGPGTIASMQMLSDNDWKVWWRGYSAFIYHYASIADSLEADCFIIGNELSRTMRPLRDEWMILIDSVRVLYKGILTYAAHSDHLAEVPFWDKLDMIGVNAHYLCDSSKTPDSKKLDSCFTAHRESLKELSVAQNTPVLFTSFGFRSVDQTAWNNDAMPSIKYQLFLHTNAFAQVNAFRSFFKVFWNQPWVAGGMIWKWEPRIPPFAMNGNGYSTKGKPSLDVIKAWFSQFKD